MNPSEQPGSAGEPVYLECVDVSADDGIWQGGGESMLMPEGGGVLSGGGDLDRGDGVITEGEGHVVV